MPGAALDGIRKASSPKSVPVVSTVKSVWLRHPSTHRFWLVYKLVIDGVTSQAIPKVSGCVAVMPHLVTQSASASSMPGGSNLKLGGAGSG